MSEICFKKNCKNKRCSQKFPFCKEHGELCAPFDIKFINNNQLVSIAEMMSTIELALHDKNNKLKNLNLTTICLETNCYKNIFHTHVPLCVIHGQIQAPFVLKEYPYTNPNITMAEFVLLFLCLRLKEQQISNDINFLKNY